MLRVVVRCDDGLHSFAVNSHRVDNLVEVHAKLRRIEMTFDELRQSLTATEAPAGLSPALAGLWWDAKGNWTEAPRDRGFTPTSIATAFVIVWH